MIEMNNDKEMKKKNEKQMQHGAAGTSHKCV